MNWIKRKLVDLLVWILTEDIDVVFDMEKITANQKALNILLNLEMNRRARQIFPMYKYDPSNHSNPLERID